MRRFLFILLTLYVGSACRSTNSSQSYTQTVAADPVIISLNEVSSVTPIDNMPFQFWLQVKPQNILATNRTKSTLNYRSQNQNLDIPVSDAAIKCMRQIFAAVASADIKNSTAWLTFRKKHPYRFLEVLPEVKDFHSQSNAEVALNFSQLTVPLLWNGFEDTDARNPTDTGFKVRGYLKWSGVLLPDGNTCMIAKSTQVLELLELSLKCEDGDPSSCNFPIESAP